MAYCDNCGTEMNRLHTSGYPPDVDNFECPEYGHTKDQRRFEGGSSILHAGVLRGGVWLQFRLLVSAFLLSAITSDRRAAGITP